jgi:hypothetical protein
VEESFEYGAIIGVDIFRVSIYDSGHLSVQNLRVGFCLVSFCPGTEYLGSIKCWEILEQLNDWRLLKKNSAQ